MENIYQRKRESENMKFCTDILRYIQLESDRYDNSCAKRNKFHESNDSFNETNDETLGNKDEKVESQSGLRRTNSYPTIFEGDISENLSENSIGLLPNDTKLLKNKTLLSLLQNQTKLLNGETLYQGESNSCDKGFEEDTIPYVTVSDENGIKFDKSQNANVVDNDTDNESEVDQEPIQSYHKRKSWSREKSHSTADISCPGKKDSFVNKCKVTVEEASQVVEARRRSHHFLWTIPDPGSQKLNWHKPPLTVLVVKKIYDESVLEPFTQLISWLIESRKMIVFVENNVMEDDIFGDDWEKKYRGRLQTFKLVHDDLTDKIDFIICLGGDGTLLHASSLFQQSCPPVMAFHQGSLGFLTPFSFDDFHTQVTNVLEGNASLLLRYRLKCVICKEDSELGRVSRIKNIDRTSPCANSQILVLNEVVVDRGSSSYICNIDLYVEGRHVTSVQGDGLIISTPTGSTAYAVAAGASMIHPNVPAIMITPICPHSLSFRPIVVPAGVELKIMLSPEARGAAMVSFDGRNRQEIHQGDSVRITTAQYPLPAVCAKDQIDDWFDRLAECLHWNVRKPQKMLSVSSTTSEHSNHSNHSVSSSLTNSQNNSTDEIDEGTS